MVFRVFFGWVFYCQPCPEAVSTVQAAAALRRRAGGELGGAQAERGRRPAAAAEPRHQAATEAGDHLHPRASRAGQPAAQPRRRQGESLGIGPEMEITKNKNP